MDHFWRPETLILQDPSLPWKRGNWSKRFSEESGRLPSRCYSDNVVQTPGGHSYVPFRKKPTQRAVALKRQD